MNANTTKPSAISAETIILGDLGTLKLTFANGKTLQVSTNDLSEKILTQAMVHGLKQKLVDAAAIARNTETGRAASIDDKYEAVREVYDRLFAGEWNKTRAAGTASSGGLLFKALCRFTPNKTPEQVRAFLDGKTKEEQAALRKNPRIAAIIEEIRAEDAKDAEGVDSDALLAGLAD